MDVPWSYDGNYGCTIIGDTSGDHGMTMVKLPWYDHGRTIVTMVVMVRFIAVFLYIFLKFDYFQVPW